MSVIERVKRAWNVFQNPYTPALNKEDWGLGSFGSNRMNRSHSYTEDSFAAPIYNQIAMDVAMTEFKHVIENDQNGDIEYQKSPFQKCLDVEANIDQTGIAFIHDLVYSMFDEGVVAAVPTDVVSRSGIKVTTMNTIHTMRVGKITAWYPNSVRVRLYNEKTGTEQDVTLAKRDVAIIENPLYAVTNAKNSTLKRLLSKLRMLDTLDEDISAGRLDLIVQLPTVVKTDLQIAEAKRRIKLLQEQLVNNKYGIAYSDASEKITQLNRPVNNQLIEQINQLTDRFYNQLGLTPAVFDGTASEAQMRLYYKRAIDPIIEYIVKEFERKFLLSSERDEGHKLITYRDPFKLVPIEQLVQLGDTFRRNTILTTNEVRKIIGISPSNDPSADILFNPNLTEQDQMGAIGSLTPPDEENQNE